MVGRAVLDVPPGSGSAWSAAVRLMANFNVGPLLAFASRNLCYQIEHHLFPDLRSNRYAQIATRLRALCGQVRPSLHHWLAAGPVSAGSSIATMTCVSGSLALRLIPSSCRCKCWARPWAVVINAVLMAGPALRIDTPWSRWLQRRAPQHRWSAVVAICLGRRLARAR